MTAPWLAQYDAGVPHAVDVPDAPLYHFLDRAADRHPRRAAISFLGGELTYAELRAQADAFATGLEALGVRPGDRVLLLLPNVPQAVVCFHGALKAGAVAVLSDPLADPAEIARQAADCGAETAVTVGRALAAVRRAGIPRVVLARVRDYMPRLRVRLSLLFGDGGVPRGVHRCADLIRRHRGERPAPRAAGADETAVLLYTGGTTAAPRACVHTHRSLVANTLQVRAFHAAAREGAESLLAAVPFYHSYGLTAGMSLGLCLAGTLVLLPRFGPGDVLRTIARCRPTLFPGVPDMYVSLISHPRVKEFRLSSIEACVSGAAPLPVEVREAFERLTHGRLVEGYGLTEAGPVTHANPLAGGGKPASIGVPLPGTEARVVDPRGGAELAIGAVGELAVRGPQLMQGYWRDPAGTARALRDGWLHTGDLATMDGDGYFQIICRRQDVIEVDGREVYPRDVEEVLYEHPKVREAAVVGGRAGVAAHVALRRGETAQAEEIMAFCRRRLSPYKVPAEVTFHRRLPRSAVGKVLRHELG